MAEPGTWALIASAVSAAGAVYSSQQQASAYNAEAAQADANAVGARRAANAQEEQTRRDSRLKLGIQRAAAVESGFDPNTGSLATLQIKSAGELELDALTSRYNGELQAMGMQQQAASLRSNASATKLNGYLSAAGSLAAGAGSYYGAQGGGQYNYRGTTLPNSLRGGG